MTTHQAVSHPSSTLHLPFTNASISLPGSSPSPSPLTSLPSSPAALVASHRSFALPVNPLNPFLETQSQLPFVGASWVTREARGLVAEVPEGVEVPSTEEGGAEREEREGGRGVEERVTEGVQRAGWKRGRGTQTTQ